jgi:YidB-like protein
MERDELLATLSEHLPRVIDHLTPEGRLPTETGSLPADLYRVEQVWASTIEGIYPAKGFLVANARHERPGPEGSRMTAVGKYATTRAPQLIDAASFGPDVLKAIGEAFDEAWAEIVGNFGEESQDTGRPGQRLAKAMLWVASDDSRDEARRPTEDGARL